MIGQVIEASEKRQTPTLKEPYGNQGGIIEKFGSGRGAVSFRLFGEPLARQIQYIKSFGKG